MLAMMEFHRRGRDDGFEGIVIVGQIGQNGLIATVVGGCRGKRIEVGRGRFGELSGKLGGMDVHRRGAESLLDCGSSGGGRHGAGKIFAEAQKKKDLGGRSPEVTLATTFTVLV